MAAPPQKKKSGGTLCMPVAFDLLYWSEFSSHVNINAVLYYALTVYFMYLCVNFVFSFRIYTVLYSRNADVITSTSEI